MQYKARAHSLNYWHIVFSFRGELVVDLWGNTKGSDNSDFFDADTKQVMNILNIYDTPRSNTNLTFCSWSSTAVSCSPPCPLPPSSTAVWPPTTQKWPKYGRSSDSTEKKMWDPRKAKNIVWNVNVLVKHIANKRQTYSKFWRSFMFYHQDHPVRRPPSRIRPRLVGGRIQCGGLHQWEAQERRKG